MNASPPASSRRALRVAIEVGRVVLEGDLVVPDLTPSDALPRVQAPTLFVLGGRDATGIERNTEAQRRLRCESALEVVPGAAKLFEEDAVVLEVAKRASARVKRFL